MTLSTGTRLGPYEILMPIGSGGMGEVYRATDTKLGRDVAIKILPEAFAADPSNFRSRSACGLRGQQRLHHVAGDISQAEVAALELERQACVVDAQAVQDRGLQIVHVHWVLRDVVTEVVGSAERHARADAAASQPHGEAARMMIAPVVGGSQPALAIHRASEFPAPDHQSLVEHAVLLQIRDQRRRWLVRLLADLGQSLGETAVMVP